MWYNNIQQVEKDWGRALWIDKKWFPGYTVI